MMNELANGTQQFLDISRGIQDCHTSDYEAYGNLTELSARLSDAIKMTPCAFYVQVNYQTRGP
jgi:hypothetical protein